MRLLRFWAGFVLAIGGTFGGQARAQSATAITRFTPDAALAGAVVIMTGNNLNALGGVIFTADTGGFVGLFSTTVPVTLISNSRASIVVPSFGFSPPLAAAQSSPFGSVRGQPIIGIPLPAFPFFYMQQTFGETTTVGQGTTQPTTSSRAVTSFALFGGPPASGNANFTLRLENAEVLATAYLALGLPAVPPYAPVLDGTLVVDLSAGPIFLGPFPVDANGDVSLALPIPGPGPFSITLMAQWGIASSGFLGVSNGLSVML